ncbi:helix-turn-helix domain-containing protein [Rummeliibacillus pycnus]|uniref:helix-turn-helix domain-containing protein n=1 Tax=Rummeliibacillus pycnus TaxID=101070 RepID=UPI003D2C293C
MIQSKLSILMANKRINISELSRDTGISRNALSNLYNEKGKGVNFETLDILCEYFGCNIEDIIKFKKNTVEE